MQNIFKGRGIVFRGKKMVSVLIIISILTSVFTMGMVSSSATEESTAIYGLTVDYRETPIGIDNESPRFAWKMSSNLVGQAQKAYRIELFENGESLPYWTKAEESDRSLGIVYDGDALKPATRYFWQVTLTDISGREYTSDITWFETGVTDEENWKNAEFICLPSSSSAPIFRTEGNLSKKVVSARLYITALGVFEAYVNGKQVGVMNSDDTTSYNHMSPGYGNAGVTLNYESYDITPYLENENAYALSVLAGNGWHNGQDNVMGALAGQPAIKALMTVAYEDGSTESISTSPENWKGTLLGPITMNSVYNGENYNANKALELGDYKNPGYDDSGWMGADVSGQSDANIIKNEFDPINAKYVQLVVTETGPGTPNDNEYRLQIMEWEIFDTDGNNVALSGTPSASDNFVWGQQWGVNLINNGDNGVQSDCGYTSENRGTTDHSTNPIIIKMELSEAVDIKGMNIHSRVGIDSMEEGVCANYPKTYTIQVSDDGQNWTDVKAVNAGTVRNGYKYTEGITTKTYSGDIIAQNGLSGWIVDEFEKTPISATLYTSTAQSSSYDGGEIAVDSHYTYSQPEDTMYHNGLTIVDSDKQIFEDGITLGAGQTLVVDMGQNMSAIPNIEFEAPQNTKVSLKFAEMLNDGSKAGSGAYEADGPKGSVYRKNLRGARCAAEYTFAGTGIESYQSKLSFYGYQYIEITATDEVKIYDIRSKAVSSVSEQLGSIVTNNENVNKLYQNALYGQLSNYFTTSTDCPQRDERTAWTGDLQVFAKTAMYNFDSVAFLSAIQDTMSTNTMINGYAASVLSLVGYFSNWATGWSDAEIIVAWDLYQQTGDKTIIENNWNAMSHYMNWLKSHERAPYQARVEGGREFGDWLSFQGTSLEVISDYYYAYVVQLMAEMAEALGKTDDHNYYNDYFDKIKEKFLSTHVTFNQVDYASFDPLTIIDVPKDNSPGTSNVITNNFTDVAGRYVRFAVMETGPGTSNDNEYRLQMMEAEVYGNNGTNLALGKSVEASSIFTWGNIWAPQFLTDGSTSAGYTSENTGKTNHRWDPLFVTIDLGSTQDISKIDIFCRTDGTSIEAGTCVNYPKHYVVQVSDDKENWETVGRYNTVEDTEEEYHAPFVIKSGTGTTGFMHAQGKGGVFEDNSQTALLWMLKLGFYKDEQMKQDAIDLLVNNIRNVNQPEGSIRNNYAENTLAVGFLGSNVITPVLTEVGMPSVSYDLLLQDEMPSWLFSVKAGATTVWERWNSYSPGVGFGDVEMNSFNHYSYGSVAEWMYEYMAGISPDTKNPGFKHTILQPTPDTGEQYNEEARINSVEGSYESYYGGIRSSWQSQSGVIESYGAVIPANTTATLYLPVESEEIEIGSLPAGVEFIDFTEHNGILTAEFELTSGGFDFAISNGRLATEVKSGYVSADNETPEEYLIGDVTGDGNISLKDVLTIQKYAAYIVEFTDVQKFVADVNKSNDVTLQDALLIQKWIVKLITSDYINTMQPMK